MIDQLLVGDGEKLSVILKSRDTVSDINCFQFNKSNGIILITKILLNTMKITPVDIHSFVDSNQQVWDVLGEPKECTVAQSEKGLLLPIDEAIDPRLVMVKFAVQVAG